MKKIVIGLVGGPSTGKGEISRLLEKKGFSPFSLSDILKIRARERGLSPTRQILTDIANDLRAKNGANALAVEMVGFLKDLQSQCIVIESIRHPEEVKTLQKELGAFVIGVSMPLEKRWELMQKRNRPGDPATWEGFLELVKSEESGVGEKTNIQVGWALEAADVKIDNNEGVKRLDEKIRELLLSRGIEIDKDSICKERK
jgi:dephospho-CoA kinase